MGGGGEGLGLALGGCVCGFFCRLPMNGYQCGCLAVRRTSARFGATRAVLSVCESVRPRVVMVIVVVIVIVVVVVRDRCMPAYHFHTATVHAHVGCMRGNCTTTTTTTGGEQCMCCVPSCMLRTRGSCRAVSNGGGNMYWLQKGSSMYCIALGLSLIHI